MLRTQAGLEGKGDESGLEAPVFLQRSLVCDESASRILSDE